MKKLFSGSIQRFFLLLAFSLSQAYIWAQDSSGSTNRTVTSETTTTTSRTEWYMQPWAWVVGGVLVLIILIALFRGNNNTTREREVNRTTVIDRDR